jgi:hypothetical protein
MHNVEILEPPLKRLNRPEYCLQGAALALAV